jgi:hypothetical protein
LTLSLTLFVAAHIDTINGVKSPWRILQPPTGSGKTQGACLYAAMQAELNESQAAKRLPVGMLIVTRLIHQAEDIAKTINEHVGRDVAVAHHSEARVSENQIRESDVLVITHQAYVNAAERLGASRTTSWERFTTWKGGKRLITVIDEALANVVESSKVSFDSLSQVIGLIPLDLRESFPEQIKALERLRDVLGSTAKQRDDTESSNVRVLWRDNATEVGFDDAAMNLGSLRIAVRKLRYDRFATSDSDNLQKRMANKYDAVLEDAQAVMQQWTFYAQKGKDHTLNSASFLIPYDVPGPVVLDATATANFLWDLFEDQAQIIPVPGKARDYSNVTLHVARASGVGKGSMVKNIKTRFPRLLSSLDRKLGSERSVFVCVHRDGETTALSYENKFKRFEVGHWGAIDGRNEWADFDTAVIFGLPYRDKIWSTGLFFAVQGPQDDEWLSNPAWKKYADVRQTMEQRQLSVSIIQAINRIRCRKTIDRRGRSLPADIFVVLPKDKTGDAILRDIEADMPELNVTPWEFTLDGPKVRRARKGTAHESLIALMTRRMPGEISISHVRRELGISEEGLKKLRSALRDKMHNTTNALSALGVRYEVRGAGRGAKSYLVKEARN